MIWEHILVVVLVIVVGTVYILLKNSKKEFNQSVRDRHVLEKKISNLESSHEDKIKRVIQEKTDKENERKHLEKQLAEKKEELRCGEEKQQDTRNRVYKLLSVLQLVIPISEVKGSEMRLDVATDEIKEQVRKKIDDFLKEYSKTRTVAEAETLINIIFGSEVVFNKALRGFFLPRLDELMESIKKASPVGSDDDRERERSIWEDLIQAKADSDLKKVKELKEIAKKEEELKKEKEEFWAAQQLNRVLLEMLEHSRQLQKEQERRAQEEKSRSRSRGMGR